MLLLTKAKLNKKNMSTNDIVIIALILLSALSGLIFGFVKKTSKLVSLAGAGVVCFFLGGAISGGINNIDSVSERASENSGWAPTVILIGSYILTFLVSYIILRIVMKLIGGILNNTGFIGRFLDKSLGLVSGVAIGFVLADIYVWILYSIACVSPDVASWVISDANLVVDGVNSFTGAIMNFNLHSIGAVFPGLA